MELVRTVALTVDIFAMSLAIGATAWFFFIQSPVLYKAMVREQFVPVQMRLSRTLFTTLLATLLVLVISAAIQTSSLLSLPTVAAGFALLAEAITKFVVFPKALRAGGESQRLHEEQGEKGTGTGFVSEGAGQSATRMHRMVVFFVVLMVAGLITHGIALATGAAVL